MLDKLKVSIRDNKLLWFVIVVLLVLLFGGRSLGLFSTRRSYVPGDASTNFNARIPTSNQIKKIEQNYLSVYIKNLDTFSSNLNSRVEELGGYVIDKDVSNNLENGIAKGTFIVAVPSDKVNDLIEAIKSSSIKIIDQQISIADVSDKFTDLERQLALYEKTYRRLEEIYDQAKDIKELLQIQGELLSVQKSIDSVKGQINYLNKASSLARIELYVSTDQYSLPYVPQGTFNIKQTVKLAVRSALTTLSKVITVLIWAVIYSPFAILYFVLKRVIGKMDKKNKG